MALAMFVHTIVNQKYVGHFVMVLYLIATLALAPAGFQDYLYRYGQTPQVTYSDINGYGPFLQPLVWFRIYWAIAAILLAIITNLLWVRGTESSWRVRMNLAAVRFSRSTRAGVAACIVGLLSVGGYIFYNTHILNPYRTTFRIDEERGQYEKKYRQYWSLPQPRITDVTTQIDIDPEQRSASVSGTLWLETKTSSDIDRIAVTLWPTNIAPLPRPHIQVQKLNLLEDKLQSSRTRPSASIFTSSRRPCRRMGGLSSTSRCNMTTQASRIRNLTPTSCITAAFSTTAIYRTSDTRPASN
jgi:hypothetical protein